MQSRPVREYYQVPKGEAESTQVVKNSRFIGTCGYAASVADAQLVIAALRTRYPDASHHAWAYIVDTLSGTIGSSDDGEPGGTAGRPMLAVLQGSGLLDVVAVGTRYFGGSKLGPGGLVRAYSDVARLALEHLQRVEYRLHSVAELRIEYPLYQKILYLANQSHCRILSSDFGADVLLHIAIPYKSVDAFGRGLADMSSGQVDLARSLVGEQYLAEG